MPISCANSCRSAIVDICYPADPGANLPDGAASEGYDGIAITGSGLHIYDGGPAISSGRSS